MLSSRRLRRPMLVAYLLVSAFLFTACCPKTVIIGSPYERYDHNRTRKIASSLSAGQHVGTEVIYVPAGSDLFPKAEYVAVGSLDSLPEANIVPIFTGVPLPLSEDKSAGERSDKEDLLHFLDNPFEGGVKPRPGAVDLNLAESEHSALISFLMNKNNLTVRGKEMINLLLLSGLVTNQDDVVKDPRNIRDSRYGYMLPNAFQEVIAFPYKKFWVVLYEPRKKQGDSSAYYSRMVVVPCKERYSRSQVDPDNNMTEVQK